MPSLLAVPRFGQPLCQPAYYEMIDSVISVLRPHSTLRAVAERLQAQGSKTPSGLDWTRMRVASYIRNRGLETFTTHDND
jgi:hypothetical protein